MKIRIDLKIFLIILIFLLTKQIQIYMIIMLFALIHEIGHLLAGIILKQKPEKVEIIPVGISITFKTKLEDINKKIGKSNLLEIKKILIALAGPITNIIIIIITLKIPINIIQKAIITYANLIIAIFNLLPIYPLDGGRILKGILNIIAGKIKTIKYINTISIISTIITTIILSIATWYNKNIAIIFICIYLWIIMIKEIQKNKQKQRIYKILEKNYWKKSKKIVNYTKEKKEKIKRWIKK